ncbi:uncharacterized protein F54H12.2-like [Saccostrea echinata]|uniref:uncharacterized protein F54H12.2-like n=1 Tax=Saccostrea echinata TaxID=191078 RepID=UPI002A7FBFCA|nr:uncharacterized protein F54H12.2-like [Saccostrea echinata]
MTSLAYADFQEGLPRELLLFNLPLTQTAVTRNFYVDCRPVSQISENGPVEFTVPGTGDYLDLKKSLLFIKARIFKADGTTIGADEKVGPVNNFLHSLFNQVDISLNGKQFPSSGGATYAYKAYLQNLLNYGEEAKQSQLQCSLFFKDDAGFMDVTDPNGANSGLYSRTAFCKESLSFDLEGPILEDVCRLDRFVLNGVDVNIKLYRQNPSFCLMSAETDPHYKVVFDDVIFRACRVQVSPGIIVGHTKTLEMTTAKYPLINTDLKVASIATGQTRFIWDNIYLTRCPSKIVLGLVSTEAQTGSYLKNPFNFQTFGARHVGVFVNNVSVPGQPYKIEENCYISAYRSLFDIVDKSQIDSGNNIDRDDWKYGYCLYGFSLQPQFGNTDTLSLMNQASVRLELAFDQALTETVSCILYAEFPSYFEIDNTRNIILNSIS